MSETGRGGDQATRIERDSMGEMPVPANALYGAQTERAVQNFPISGRRFPRPFIRALGSIKQAAAAVNRELGVLEQEIAEAIDKAAQEVIDGVLDDHFVLDIYQTGSGTSTNMNANEVIANRATAILGGQIGSHMVHPNDHVNMGQSSNDVIPTAIHIAALFGIEKRLLPALQELRKSLRAKAEEFDAIVKIGRTHLQDATPIRLGQEFSGYAHQIELGLGRVAGCRDALGELALGGTAVGTGLNTDPQFPPRVIERLNEMTGLTFREAANHFEAQGAQDGLVEASGALKTVAVSLMKIAHDIRSLGSGPRCGLGEIRLPAVQPGSSIMPGKINPVIAESVIQVATQVIGNDLVVTLGGQWGSFELNTMLPVMASNLLESIDILANATANFSARCVAGIKADEERIGSMIEQSLAICTALAPVIGYDEAAQIAKESYETGKTVRQVAMERGVLPEDELGEILDPRHMTEPGIPGR
ncbi:MAG: class II fumarate hydratase [Acidobacteriota bacterium]